MLIGAMNHPARDASTEIKWMAEMGLEFIDLTLEPPLADVRHVDLQAIRKSLASTGFPVVGHTAYYLPLCHPFESVRRAAVEELKLCLAAFAEVGARWMNIHPDSKAPLHERKFIIERNLQTIRELLPLAQKSGVGLMIENLPGSFNTVKQLGELLDAVPELGLHLDIGHANLLVSYNTTDEILSAYGHRLKHVHLHDNKGGSSDLHLPLGAGNIDTAHYVRSLKSAGYDGTITLEVFTTDRQYLLHSREMLRGLWDKPAG
jgi:sugar phosphate isomerase/epimerase